MNVQEAAAELLRRRRARASLADWCRVALEPLGQAPARHHLAMIEKLEALSRGDIDRLILLAPPGAAKSTYVSTLFPAWYLAQHPGSAIIAASHTAELAERFGRRVRNLISEHSVVLGYGLSSDNAAAGRWETNNGSEYFSVGIGGAVSGRRADLLVIDDPVRSRNEADSDLVSQRTWDWYNTDALTRLKPGGKIVLVQTRWNTTDLGGRIEDEMAAGGKPWDILRLPMVAETDDPLGRKPGELLWPGWFNDDMLAQAKRDSRTFASLYQQNPVPDTGGFFQASWIRPVATIPPRDELRVFGAADYAVTSKGGDYTCIVIVGIDSEDRMYLLDVWRQQATSDAWVEAVADLILKWKPMGFSEESGQIKSSIGPWLDKRLRERKAYVARTAFPTRGDKSARAQSIRGRMSAQGLYVPENAPWRAEFETELLSFPVGKHDDQVDALSLSSRLMDIMIPPPGTKPPPRPTDPWASAFRRLRGKGSDGQSWKTV